MVIAYFLSQKCSNIKVHFIWRLYILYIIQYKQFRYIALVVLVTAAALLPHCQSFDCTQENVEGIHYRPVNGHCNQFYECIGAVSKHFECAAGNLFDSSLGRCHDEKLVDCYDCDIDENSITYHADRKSCNV